MALICSHQEMGVLIPLVAVQRINLLVKNVSSTSQKCLDSGISQTFHYLLSVRL